MRLVDVRDNDEHDVASRQGIREGCLRIQTVANDCSLGKMLAAVEVAAGWSGGRRRQVRGHRPDRHPGRGRRLRRWTA